MFVDDFIAESQQRASTDPAWLGTVDHLNFLSPSLEQLGVSEVKLAWGAPGTASNWNGSTRTIELERPVLTPYATPEQLAEETVLGLVHEALHAQFSTPSSIMRRLTQIPAGYRPSVATMFNILEDGRLGRLTAEHRPDLIGAVETHAEHAVDQLDARSGQDGSGTTPPHPSSQLFFAVMAYSLAPDRAIVVHPAVSAELAQLRPTVDRARTGAATEFCVDDAVELVSRISPFRVS